MCLALLHETNPSWDAWPPSIKNFKVTEKRSLSRVIHGPCWLGPLSAAASSSPAGIQITKLGFYFSFPAQTCWCVEQAQGF